MTGTKEWNITVWHESHWIHQHNSYNILFCSFTCSLKNSKYDTLVHPLVSLKNLGCAHEAQKKYLKNLWVKPLIAPKSRLKKQNKPKMLSPNTSPGLQRAVFISGNVCHAPPPARRSQRRSARPRQKPPRRTRAPWSFTAAALERGEVKGVLGGFRRS